MAKGAKAVAVKNVLEAVRQTLFEEMERDERVILMGEDVGQHGGVMDASKGLLERFGEERVIDTPLAESGIVGTAIGAALGGLLPIAEIQFADFIHPAVDQLINEAAKIRYRSNNDFHCPMVVRTPYGGGITGGLYHSQNIEALFFSTPGLKIVAPSTPADVKGLLRASIYDPDPVIFLEHKLTYRSVKGEFPEGDHYIPLGKADVKRSGSDLTVISYGMTMHYALNAAQRLEEEEGVDVEVIDLCTILPLDRETIVESVKKTGKVLIVHEDNLTGGVGAEVAATISDGAFMYLDAPVRRLAAPDVPSTPYHPVLEQAVLPNEEQIYEALLDLARY